MEEHKKLKSPKSISVKRVIPTLSVFIIVFMLSFMLFLALTANTTSNGGGRTNSSIKAEEMKLINHAKTCIIEKNGSNAKYILGLINNLIKKHEDYNFSTTYLKCKSDLAKFIKDFELEKMKDEARDFRLKDFSDYASDKAKEHLKKLEEIHGQESEDRG